MIHREKISFIKPFIHASLTCRVIHLSIHQFTDSCTYPLTYSSIHTSSNLPTTIHHPRLEDWLLVHLRSEVFTATQCNEVFSGYQPCQFGMNFNRFGDCLCHHHQGLMWREELARWATVAETFHRDRDSVVTAALPVVMRRSVMQGQWQEKERLTNWPWPFHVMALSLDILEKTTNISFEIVFTGRDSKQIPFRHRLSWLTNSGLWCLQQSLGFLNCRINVDYPGKTLHQRVKSFEDIFMIINLLFLGSLATCKVPVCTVLLSSSLIDVTACEGCDLTYILLRIYSCIHTHTSRHTQHIQINILTNTHARCTYIQTNTKELIRAFLWKH
jgi:hypothetical protein